MRIALGLEYDGAKYCGWQSQANGGAIQDCLEHALQKMANHTLRVSAAGRTDAGVHALSQIVHFDTLTTRPMSAWVRGVNANLPDSIRVLWAQAVDARFHARFDAQQRSYQYLLINQPVAPAVMAGKAGWFHLPLDIGAMQFAAEYLLGQHDFSAFRAAECQAKSPVKFMHRASVVQIGNGYLFDFCAGAFLHHQVRNMVGALVYIGKGKYKPEYMETLLASRDRRLSPPTFSPAGLYLTGVGYDAMWDLPETERTLNFGCLV
ncbi:MAG: tRNA pseudouridine(38-40) synthase TruA [Methylophilaceae bacterium]|nr:tRNA pseudouridine(38-40) synthase TruA [Methylophilaceae bacterium]